MFQNDENICGKGRYLSKMKGKIYETQWNMGKVEKYMNIERNCKTRWK